MKKIILNFLVLVLLVSTASADVDKHFTSGCPFNGDGSAAGCAASGGAAGAWNSCTNAVTGLQTLYSSNLTTAGVGSVNLNMHNTGGAAEPQCTLTGIVTDSTHLVRVKTSGADVPILGAQISTTLPRFSCSSNATACLQCNLLYCEFDKLQGENTGTGTGAYYVFGDDTTSGLSLKATNLIMKSATCNVGSGGECGGLTFFPNVANTRLTLVNTISFGTSLSTNYLLRAGGGNNGETLIIYNNGGIGGTKFIFRFDGNGTGDTLIAKNNWMQGTGLTFGSWFLSAGFGTYTHNNNISEDATSPEGAGAQGKVITFVSSGTGNYAPAAGDTSAKGQGADLSADGTYSFSTDVFGATRSAPWDIGPIKYTASVLTTSLTSMKVSGTH